MVSDAARQKLKALAEEHRMFMGDVVDILLGIKEREVIEAEYAQEKRIKRKSWGLGTDAVHTPR
jgi:hypothetical protein